MHLVRETRFGNVMLCHLGSDVSHTQAQELQVHAVLDAHQTVAVTQPVERNAWVQPQTLAEALHLQ